MKRLVLLERVAWGVGLYLIAVFAIARVHGALSSRLELARFEAARTACQQATEPASGARSPLPAPTGVDLAPWSEGRVRAYPENQDEEGSRPHALASLDIPRLRLTVPVIEGTDELTLNRGVGHGGGTALPGERGYVGNAPRRYIVRAVLTSEGRCRQTQTTYGKANSE